MVYACIVLSIARTIEHYVQIGRSPAQKQISRENRMEAFEKKMFAYIWKTQCYLKILIGHSVLVFSQCTDPH